MSLMFDFEDMSSCLLCSPNMGSEVAHMCTHFTFCTWMSFAFLQSPSHQTSVDLDFGQTPILNTEAAWKPQTGKTKTTTACINRVELMFPFVFTCSGNSCSGWVNRSQFSHSYKRTLTASTVGAGLKHLLLWFYSQSQLSGNRLKDWLQILTSRCKEIRSGISVKP